MATISIALTLDRKTNLDKLTAEQLRGYLAEYEHVEALDPNRTGLLISYARARYYWQLARADNNARGQELWAKTCEEHYAKLPNELRFRPKTPTTATRKTQGKGKQGRRKK